MEVNTNGIAQQNSPIQEQTKSTRIKSAPIQEVKTQVENTQEKSNQGQPLTKESEVQNLVDTLNESLNPFNTSIRFGFDNQDSVFFVSVIDSNTNDVIRRFPAEQAQSLVAKMNEIVGIIFDEKG